jgi:hypothetical protein
MRRSCAFASASTRPAYGPVMALPEEIGGASQPRGTPVMSRPTEPRFICVTCEVEIVGRPTFYVGLPFCCAGCVADGPCICSYDVEPEPAGATPSVAARELVAAGA